MKKNQDSLDTEKDVKDIKNEVTDKSSHIMEQYSSGRVPKGTAAFFAAFSEYGRKGAAMAKYFMNGTKYKPYERMMMSPNRNYKFYEPQRKKNYPTRKGTRETQRKS